MRKRNIRLIWKDKLYYVGAINPHSISMHQRLFDLFCSVTNPKLITSINFINWLNSFNVLSLNELNKENEK
jgi:hypothetical protein